MTREEFVQQFVLSKVHNTTMRSEDIVFLAYKAWDSIRLEENQRYVPPPHGTLPRK
jgi:hypothetical protein